MRPGLSLKQIEQRVTRLEMTERSSAMYVLAVPDNEADAHSAVAIRKLESELGRPIESGELVVYCRRFADDRRPGRPGLGA